MGISTWWYVDYMVEFIKGIYQVPTLKMAQQVPNKYSFLLKTIHRASGSKFQEQATKNSKEMRRSRAESVAIDDIMFHEWTYYVSQWLLCVREIFIKTKK